MNDEHSQEAADQRNSPHLRMLAILAILSTCLYGVISFLSWRFDFDSPRTERPIIVVLLLLAVTFVGYLFAIRLATRAPQDKRLVTLIVWAAVLFRVTLLPSVPIQEVDIYRYVWDGSVSAAGVSPFRYIPEQVRVATADAMNDEPLAKLVRLRDEQPALAEVLRRIHYGELPTIYPPTSQAVFTAAVLTTPPNASVLVRVFIMKAWFIGFDLAALFVILALLRLCRMPVGLCVVYAWCPLLLKEVANSGHLDAVAVFLTTLAIYLTARLLARTVEPPEAPRGTVARATLVFVVLALAVGAKLYPIVVAPLLCLVLAKHLGWRRLLVPMTVFAVTTYVIITPMMPHETTSASASGQVAPADSLDQLASPPGPADDSSLGVVTFLRRWEMNDFIFLVVVENLKPATDLPPGRTAWFSVVPESVRQSLVSAVSARLGVAEAEVPFLVTRALTGTTFLVLACWFAWRAARKAEIASLCEAGFLTLAWFWLLCPTQNPWYWIWALPLLPFARSRAWLAVSGLLLLYYLRFWFSYHWDDTPVLGTRYVGTAFFDFIVPWVEFGPWFAWLGADVFPRSRGK